MSLKDGLQQLLRVQDVDLKLRELEEAKSEYPAEIEKRRGEIDRAERDLKELTERLEDQQRRQRHLEHELEDARDQLKKLEARFSEVRTNKEYDALQLEVEACKSRMSEYEGQILELIESSESVREQVDLEQQDVDGVREEQQSRIDELQGRLDTLQGEVDAVLQRREAEAEGIDRDLLRTYEISRSNRGLTVAAVRKGACGACFRQLPAQMKSRVRRHERVVSCESCGALLAWDEESS